MGIDSRFRIEMDLLTTLGERRQMTVPASEFFEFEEFDDTEWGCDLPWRLASLEDYLPVDKTELYELAVHIIDLEIEQHCKIYELHLLSSTLSICWTDIRSNPSRFEIIMDIAPEKASPVQVARIDVDHGQTVVTSHSLIDGDSIQPLEPRSRGDS